MEGMRAHHIALLGLLDFVSGCGARFDPESRTESASRGLAGGRARRPHANSPHTCDARINGAPTACTGSTTGMSIAFTSVTVMDASNAGFGGEVDFDDLVAKASIKSTYGLL